MKCIKGRITLRSLIRSCDQDCLTIKFMIYDSRFSTTFQFTTMATAQIIHCIACKEPIQPRQQGLQCNGCFRWNHRVCNTGISLEVCRAAVREGSVIQREGAFFAGIDNHSHPREFGAFASTQIQARVNQVTICLFIYLFFI